MIQINIKRIDIDLKILIFQKRKIKITRKFEKLNYRQAFVTKYNVEVLHSVLLCLHKS